MTVTTDWYAILGIKTTATEDEIKKAYRKKALQYHPDKNSSTAAEEIFKEINKAYEILGDTDKRRVYDLQQQTPKVNVSSTQANKTNSSNQSFFNSKNHHSSRFQFHDPFFNLHQRQTFFNHSFRSPHFSFFDTHFGSSSSDEDEHEYDPFDSIPSAFRSSHNHFRRKTPSKWDHPWSFDSDPFMMFEMLTRSLFDQFLHDDLFWHHSSSGRLRSASHQHRGTSTNRTRIPVNHVTPASKFRTDIKRTTSSACFNHKDSDEENLDEQYVYQEPKPTTSTNTNSSFARHSTEQNTNTKPKLEACRYCFYPSASIENRLKHEAVCRHRTDQDRVYTTKCSYCQQNIRLSDYLHHEELCKQFGMKRPTTATTETRRYYNPMSTSLNADNQFHGKSSSAGISNDINRLRTCHRCRRNFPVLSDLFNHVCDDELEQNSSNSTTTSAKSDDKQTNDSQSQFDNITSTSPKSFKLNTNSSLDTPSLSSRTYKLISPLSPSSSPIINRSDLTSIHVQPRNDSSNKNQSSLETEHIPLFKRPLFRPDISATNDKDQHSSNSYIYLRNPSTPLRVNS